MTSFVDAPTHTARVRIQRSAAGRVLGAAMMIPVRTLNPYIRGESEYLNLEMIPQAEGILLKIGGCES